jgi:hypothetical protein
MTRKNDISIPYSKLIHIRSNASDTFTSIHLKINNCSFDINRLMAHYSCTSFVLKYRCQTWIYFMFYSIISWKARKYVKTMLTMRFNENIIIHCKVNKFLTCKWQSKNTKSTNEMDSSLFCLFYFLLFLSFF